MSSKQADHQNKKPMLKQKNNKLLLHTCCAPCLGYSIQKAAQLGFEPSVYFFNPNIHPIEEYKKRRDELIAFCKKKNYDLIVEPPEFERWHGLCDPMKDEPEKGKRCNACFLMRLEKTAKHAKENAFPYFSTTLTISPHKSYKVISEIGNKLAKDFSLEYLDVDFKKNDGFKKSIEISRENNLFRQTYCGCEFSIRKS